MASILPNTFIFEGIHGTAVECNTVFNFSCGGQKIIVFTDNTIDYTGCVRLYTAIEHIEDDHIYFEEVNDEHLLNEIESLILEFFEAVEQNNLETWINRYNSH